MGYALEVSGLTKRIKRRQILCNINITVGYGETAGLIGANGAGKTSVIKCIAGLWRNYQGSIRICGYDLACDFVACMKESAAIVEYPKLFSNLTLQQNIDTFGSFGKTKDAGYAAELLRLLGLKEARNNRIRTYSSGMHQKACLLIALLRRPKILLLDEPTSMLDPKSAAELRHFLSVLKKDGLSMLISSHNLREVETLCDKVWIIDKGKETSVIDLRQGVKRRRYVLEFAQSAAAANVYRAFANKYDCALSKNKLYVNADAMRFRALLTECGEPIADIYEGEQLESAFLSAITGAAEHGIQKYLLQ